MKREGRQHGMVRSYLVSLSPLNPTSSPETRPNMFDSSPTAGLFTKVSSKPTNHSKFTGKCGRPRCTGCHINPVCKSKDKVKGTQKLRSYNVISNYRMVTWRVVDAKPGSKFSGFSATGFLDDLDNNNDYDDEEDDLDDNGVDDECVDDVYQESCVDTVAPPPNPNGLIAESEIASGAVEIREDHDDVENCDNHDYDYDEEEDSDHMSFCDLGVFWEQVDADDDWCLVNQQM